MGCLHSIIRAESQEILYSRWLEHDVRARLAEFYLSSISHELFMFAKVIYLFVLVFLICEMGSLIFIYIELYRVN